MQTKICKKCGTEKPVGAFHSHKQTRDRLRPACKECTRRQNKAWQDANPERYREAIEDWWKRHPEKLKEKAKRRKAENPDYWQRHYAANKERYAANSTSYYLNNKDRIRDLARRYREANPDVYRAHSEKWRKKNPDKIRMQNHRRRASRAAVYKFTTEGALAALMAGQDYRCANPYCRADLRECKPHIDHKHPISRGGGNEIENLQWLCSTCNLSKSKLTMDEWMARLETQKAA